MRKTEEITIRDPFVLVHDGKYYLYGTRSETCWDKADGFDCYISTNMEDWDGPIEIFHKPEDFFATEKYWAPECHFYDGAFYLFCTFASEQEKTCMYLLRSERPEGPYEVYSEQITPKGWACIDGTFYEQDGEPYLIFSRTFEDVLEGQYWITKLSADLKHAVGEPQLIFNGKDAGWSRPIPFAKDVMGIEEDAFLTDGPCPIRLPDGTLGMTWSSFGENGYAVGLAISRSGRIEGPWEHVDEAVDEEDGGHGMFFDALDGTKYFVMHSPDEHFKEKPCFKKVKMTGHKIQFY